MGGVNRWLVALLLVTVVGGGLRAREALSPHARQSADERSYVSVAIGLADTGRYGKQSLHWPPGAPVAFAAAAKLSGRVVRGSAPDIPAAYWVQWLAGTALIPLVSCSRWRRRAAGRRAARRARDECAAVAAGREPSGRDGAGVTSSPRRRVAPSWPGSSPPRSSRPIRR